MGLIFVVLKRSVFTSHLYPICPAITSICVLDEIVWHAQDHGGVHGVGVDVGPLAQGVVGVVARDCWGPEHTIGPLNTTTTICREN